MLPSIYLLQRVSNLGIYFCHTVSTTGFTRAHRPSTQSTVDNAIGRWPGTAKKLKKKQWGVINKIENCPFTFPNLGATCKVDGRRRRPVDASLSTCQPWSLESDQWDTPVIDQLTSKSSLDISIDVVFFWWSCKLMFQGLRWSDFRGETQERRSRRCSIKKSYTFLDVCFSLPQLWNKNWCILARPGNKFNISKL